MTKQHPDATVLALVHAIEANGERLVAEMAATRGAVELRGALTVPLTGASQRITYAPSRILGFALLESSGGAGAIVRLRDGDAGDLIVPVSLAAGESAREWWGPGGVSTTAGIYLEVVSGAVVGSIFVGPA